MDAWEIFTAAFNEYNAKNFDAALELVDVLKNSPLMNSANYVRDVHLNGDF